MNAYRPSKCLVLDINLDSSYIPTKVPIPLDLQATIAKSQSPKQQGLSNAQASHPRTQTRFETRSLDQHAA